MWFHQRGTSHSLGWFGLFFVAKNVIPNTPHLNSNRKKTNKYRRTLGQICNTDDVFRAKMWREIANKNREKSSVFCDSTRKVPHAVWAVFWGKIRFWTPQNSTERPQDRPDNRKPDANIGCTVGVVYKRDGSKNQKEARRKKQTLGNLWGGLGSLWETLWGDLGEALGRLRERFFDETCLIFIIIEWKTVWSPKSSIIPQNGLNLLFDKQKGLCD